MSMYAPVLQDVEHEIMCVCVCVYVCVCVCLQDVEHEIRIMKKMDHPNCVKLYEVCAQTNGNEGGKKIYRGF